MFYIMINIVVMNLYLLSAYTPVPEKRKFTKQIKFRETLCKTFFTHLISVVALVESTATLVNRAVITGIKINHHKVSIKRAPYVIYK